MTTSGHSLIYAHRGANREAPENTRHAFERALDHAIDGIETDVQLTRDEVAVLWHDEFLDRIGLPGRRIGDFDLAQLRAMDFGAQAAAGAQPAGIMTLDEFISAYRRRCRLLIEIKHFARDTAARREIKVRRALDLAGPANGDAILVSSFDLACLVHAHRCRPGFPLVYNLTEQHTLADAQQALAAHTHLHGLCLPIATLDEAMVNLLRRREKCVAVYTCNSVAEIGRAMSLGVDILISDVPQQALAQRNR